jgi:hypothetical protein
MIQAILAFAQILLLVLRYIEHRGKVNDARLAVEADLQVLRKKLRVRSANARANVDTSPDSVRVDPNNRESVSRGDRPGGNL